MVNPAKFDKQQVIEQAMVEFWRRGFYATSMRHLQQAVDMRPGSIYAAFGSKEGLFREALECYVSRNERRLAACLQQTGSPLQALREFFYRAVIAPAESAPSQLCLLARTVAELTDEDQGLRDVARGHLLRMEQAFAQLLSQAAEQGELADGIEPKAMAPMLQMQLMGLRSHAQLINNLEVTERLLDQVFQPLQVQGSQISH